jgi:hypothetical protein
MWTAWIFFWFFLSRTSLAERSASCWAICNDTKMFVYMRMQMNE